MEAKVKRTTDNVENLIKELEKQYVGNKPDNMMKERELFM